MATNKATKKKASAKKPSRKKAPKKIQSTDVNPQITDAVTVTENEGKVYSMETPTVESTPEPTPVPETAPTTEETTTVTASYSEIASPSNRDNAVLYIAAALGIILLAWMLVL